MTERLKNKVQDYIWYYEQHGDEDRLSTLLKEDMIKLLREINEENKKS